MAHGVDLVFPFIDPSHCCLLPTFQFSHFVDLVSQSIFSPVASCVPKAQLYQAAFLCWDYLLKTIFAQGPFILTSSYQLNPTDFAFIKHSSILFLFLKIFV